MLECSDCGPVKERCPVDTQYCKAVERFPTAEEAASRRLEVERRLPSLPAPNEGELELLRQNKTIAAIKAYRTRTGTALDEAYRKLLNRPFGWSPQPSREVQAVQLLREILAEAEAAHQRSRNVADDHNNNTPGVGQTVAYMLYDPLPPWYQRALALVQSAGV